MAGVTAVLTAGNRYFQERVLLSLLEGDGVEASAQHEAFERLLTEAVTLPVRTDVVGHVGRGQPERPGEVQHLGRIEPVLGHPLDREAEGLQILVVVLRSAVRGVRSMRSRGPSR